MNKTGTSSMVSCLSILGIAPLVSPSRPIEGLEHATNRIFNFSDYEPALEIAENYRGFKDRPWNVWEAYRHLDQRFQDSLFILTVRNAENWWKSADLWVSGENSFRVKTYLTHLRVRRWKKRKVIEAYNKHNDTIKDYFRGTGRLFVCDLESGDAWEPLCEFLDIPVPEVKFPHVNKQSYEPECTKKGFRRIWPF
jgi:hypothetical protein